MNNIHKQLILRGGLSALLLAGLALLALAPRPAQAADPYLLGSRLVITTSNQIVDPNSGWWGDKLPDDYRFSLGSIIKAINDDRRRRGVTAMIDPAQYPISIGWETKVEGGYDYNIDFMKMSPADVEAALKAFPVSGAFPGAKTRVEALKTGYFNGNTQELNKLSVVLADGVTFELKAGENYSAARERLQATLEKLFGTSNLKFDFFWSTYSYATGGQGMDCSITVYLDGAEQQNMAPMGEGGE